MLQIRRVNRDNFLYFAIKASVVNCLIETVIMRDPNICFHCPEIRKRISKLLSKLHVVLSSDSFTQ